MNLFRRKPQAALPVASVTETVQVEHNVPDVVPSSFEIRHDPAEIRRQAMVSVAASEAAISIGWITHDAAQVADQTRLIAAASEEVAASTSEIAARSRTSADTAERARAGIVECAGDMRQASERMSLIEARTTEIGGCLDGFSAAARRIEEMASAIAAISAQTMSSASRPTSVEMRNPMPRVGLPKNSATIAPIRASVVVIFNPLNRNGIAAGRRSFIRLCQ